MVGCCCFGPTPGKPVKDVLWQEKGMCLFLVGASLHCILQTLPHCFMMASISVTTLSLSLSASRGLSLCSEQWLRNTVNLQIPNSGHRARQAGGIKEWLGQ